MYHRKERDTIQLIIAEKPSVAQAISKVLHITTRRDGYMENDNYIVSWCIGHLVGLCVPEHYGEQYKKWDMGSLPISPFSWETTVLPGKEKQFRILEKLMQDNQIQSVICATDAGREGELIFRLVYHQADCRKPIKRLWISSMEDTAIKQGFENLKDGGEYDNLYLAADCRQKADWLVGINLTRLFSVLYNSTLNVGRVQTPTLAMLVERDTEVKQFQKQKFYKVCLDLGFQAVSDRIDDKSTADQIQAACTGQTAAVSQVERKAKTENPPTLYDLTTLQREANRLYGFTAEQTLTYTQSLYEKQLVTYPRTDSRYLTGDMGDTHSTRSYLLYPGGGSPVRRREAATKG